MRQDTAIKPETRRRLEEVNGHKEITGGEQIIQFLIRSGVDTIFGIPGGANLPIYDAIPKYEKAGLVKHYLTGQEGGAIHAAQGYSRATGKLGVCFATSGPGATNIVTGLQDAKSDSTPILAITGQVGTSLLGTDAFQETDVVGVTMPCTKHNYLVKDPNELLRTLKQARYIATSGRPGPVLIDVPKDVAAGKVIPDWSSLDEVITGVSAYKQHIKPDLSNIEEAMNAINKSERPILYIGGGVVNSNAHKELRQFAEEMGIPVVTTFTALGAFPGTHQLYLGAPGMHGTVAANYALNLSDCVIAIGPRFDDRVTGKKSEFAKFAKKVIHVDIDNAEIGKIRKADIPIHSDAKEALEHLVSLSHKTRNKRNNYDSWREQTKEWKIGWPTTYNQNEGKISPQSVIEELCKMAPEAIITTGVGQHQMYTTQFYKFNEPRKFISSLGLATMGFGLPAAVGAQVAMPDSLVVDIDGDGSFNMNVQELATIGRYKLPVKAIILDNKFLGMVDQWQKGFYARNRSGVDTAYGEFPNFVKIAEGYGIAGKRISQPCELKHAMKVALSYDGPFVLHLDVDPEAEVYPIVGPGQAWHEMTYPFKDLPTVPKY